MQESRVYYSQTLYLFWTTSQKMRTSPAFTKELLEKRLLPYFNNYTKKYEDMVLDDLDIQVLMLYMMGEQIQNLYRACNDVFWYLAQGRDFCYLVNIPYDLSGCPLKPIKYGRELRELAFTHSDTFSNGMNITKCLLNKCGDVAEK